MGHEENGTATEDNNAEYRKKLSTYFEEVTEKPLCDAIAHSIREFSEKDAVYQDLDEEEAKWEKKFFELLETMEQEDADVVDGYMDAIQATCYKEKELAYMAGVRDAVMMLRYMDVIKDRW